MAVKNAITDAKQVMLDREVAAREAAEHQRDEHLLAEQIRAEAKSEELDTLMASVTEAERRRIRLEAAIMLHTRGSGGMYGALKQLQFDELTLELARYSISGSV